jgi:hypothetical protein
MANPKLLVCKFAQDGPARKCEHEESSNEGSLPPIRISRDFVKRIYVDQKNSNIPKLSSKNTFIGPLLVIEDYIDGRISVSDFKLLTRNMDLKRG